MIPISKEMIEPVFTSNISYVDSLEEFENIQLKPNETRLAFDNNQSCFYVREKDKFGVYSSIKVYFYENFAEKAQRIEKEHFIDKCRKVGFDELKTEIACKFFLENKKPQEVWLWLIDNNIKDCEWDTVKKLKHNLKVKLFPELVKKKVDKIIHD